MNKLKLIKNTIIWLLLGTSLTPLLVSNKTLFPFVFPKIAFFRILVELSVVFAAVLFIVFYENPEVQNIRKKARQLITNKLFMAISLFLISMTLSSLFADNWYRAFWGDIERGEGLFGILHVYVFLILSVLFFEKKDWYRYFLSSLITCFILIIYAFFEYFGLKFWFLSPRQDSRPGTFIGNPAFFATHLIFISIFSGLFYFLSEAKRTFIKLFCGLIFTLALVSVFLTGTRGAILGIFAGLMSLLLLVSFSKKITNKISLGGYYFHVRSISILFSIFVVLFGLFFLQTRSSNSWQSIPGLNRLAGTSFFDVNDPSTQFRVITWDLSWKAFKERPLFGWGPENYIVAYEKYYNPKYALYGETWLDRAHNKVFDVLVMQGILGLVSYFLVFAAIFYSLWKWAARKSAGEFLPIFLTAGIIAYFVQNLFIFDQFLSNITFFALLGFIIYEVSGFSSEGHVSGGTSKNTKLFLKVILLLAAFISLYSIFNYNFIPYMQAVQFKASPGVSQNAYLVESAVKQAITPFNFAQFNIRNKGIDEIYSSQYFNNEKYVTNPKLRPIGVTLINSIQEIVDKEPHDVRVHIRAVEMLNNFSHGMSEDEIRDSKIFEKVEFLIRDALKRAPNRQELHYHLAFNLAAQEKYDEAIKEAQYAIDLEPGVARSKYHLALVLYLAGKKEALKAALEETVKISPNFERFMPDDLNNIAVFYQSIGLDDKFGSLLKRTLLSGSDKEKINFTLSRNHYEDALRYFISKKDSESVSLLAKYLSGFEDLKSDMERVLDLVKKNDWKSLIVASPEPITIDISKEYYENQLRVSISKKDKTGAISAAEFLVNKHPDYASEVGIDAILDLLKKDRWDIIEKLP